MLISKKHFCEINKLIQKFLFASFRHIMNKLYARHLIGLGLDAKDNHKRITRGDYFHIVGGSEETHSDMQEKTIKLVETLGRKGKSIVTASDYEFFETAMELGINVFPSDNN
ncbi:MAG: hypothetical protein ACD_79C00650G0006 [uncultured bacterium]|nr:MAG: hypothetical protein ACD_79C00650G0006 [uncultured bacterium]